MPAVLKDMMSLFNNNLSGVLFNKFQLMILGLLVKYTTCLIMLWSNEIEKPQRQE